MERKQISVCVICNKGIVPGHEVASYEDGFAHKKCVDDRKMLGYYIADKPQGK